MLEYVECKFSGQVDVKERNLIYFILKVTLYVNIWSKNCMLQIWIVLFSTRLFCETCQFSFLDWQNNLRAIRCKHHDTEMEKMRKKIDCTWPLEVLTKSAIKISRNLSFVCFCRFFSSSHFGTLGLGQESLKDELFKSFKSQLDLFLRKTLLEQVS